MSQSTRHYGDLRHFYFLLLLHLFTFLAPSIAKIAGPPHGVSLAKASLYYPNNDENWTCLDGLRTIRFLQINDDFCDCEDGSDEPGTAACPGAHFHCINAGHRALDIPSSRVNDGICDCCDASDEYAAEATGAVCQNTCRELGAAEQEQRKSEAELLKRGATRRIEIIARGKQLRAERDERRAELERRRSEQELLKAEEEQIKRSAEVLEAEALEMYKEQQRELDAAAAETAKAEESAQTLREEAETSFVRYDVNKDGFVEVTELQVDMALDSDRNGVITVEEAKYYLDERDRIDLEGFVTLSWPRIKPMQMLSQGLFKPPVVEGEGEDEAADMLKPADQHTDGDETQQQNAEEDGEEREHAEFDGEEEEDTYEDEEADVGVGSVTAEANTPAPEYDPETQRLIDRANEARNAFAEVERRIREIEHELKEIDDQNAKDYGASEEYASMDGECYNFEDREYVYTLCPFDRASQKSRNGGAETTLGRWDHWVAEGGNKYASQKYAHGASCWNGPQRSALVHLRCALEHRITAVTEPNRCEYYFEFETPAACDEAAYGHEEEEHLHEEL